MKKSSNKKIKINDRRPQIIAIIIAIVLICVVAIVIILRMIANKNVANEISTESVEQEVEWFSEEQGNTELNEIIQNNISDNQIKEVIETQEVILEYETEYQNNDQLPKGYIQVLQQGEEGKQQLIIRKKYQGKELVSDEQIGRKIIYPTINRIVEVGTSTYYSNKKIKVGDIVYSTPYNLDIRREADKASEVIIRISQNSKLVIKQKKNNWYYVEYDTYLGWIENDCVTYITPDVEIAYDDSPESQSKQQLLSNLGKNMNVNKPSGLTLDQFQKIFENEEKDVNGIFEENAKYFYYIEQEYGINGVFVAAIGIHESGWGTSKIALNKKNLFGYGAYDMNAYASAYSYNGYAAGIDMIARVLVKNYLNPKGTSIYNGETATGQYYNGNTIFAVNKKYATDSNWANGIYRWMEYLYKKI